MDENQAQLELINIMIGIINGQNVNKLPMRHNDLLDFFKNIKMELLEKPDEHFSRNEKC